MRIPDDERLLTEFSAPFYSKEWFVLVRDNIFVVSVICARSFIEYDGIKPNRTVLYRPFTEDNFPEFNSMERKSMNGRTLADCSNFMKSWFKSGKVAIEEEIRMYFPLLHERCSSDSKNMCFLVNQEVRLIKDYDL